MRGPERVEERSLEIGYGPVLVNQHQAHGGPFAVGAALDLDKRPADLSGL
jgi:hypothetical protein